MMHRMVCQGWRFRYRGGILGQRRLFPEVYDRPTPVEIPRAIPPDLGIQPTPVAYDPPDRAPRALSPADREAAETLARARQLNLPSDAVAWKCVVCEGAFPHRQCATCHDHIHLHCFGRQRSDREDAGDNSAGLECPACVAKGGGHSGEPREPVDGPDPWFLKSSQGQLLRRRRKERSMTSKSCPVTKRSGAEFERPTLGRNRTGGRR